MKKNQKLAFILFNLALFICAGSFKPATAQEDDLSREPGKYEITVDLIDFFSGGYPNKVLFKVNNINDNKVTGAYRFGVGGSSSLLKYYVTQDGENYELTGRSNYNRASLIVGYEFQKDLERAVFYYGADIGTILSSTDNKNEPDVETFFDVKLVPFLGIKMPLAKNLSTALEVG